MMAIRTEPIGSLPRPAVLIEAIERYGAENPVLDSLYEQAIRETIAGFEAAHGTQARIVGAELAARTPWRG